jgi:hypothetical protein
VRRWQAFTGKDAFHEPPAKHSRPLKRNAERSHDKRQKAEAHSTENPYRQSGEAPIQHERA